MNRMAERFAADQIGSIFLYTHEAHPGEYYPHLSSFEQKLHNARDLRDKLGVTRPILVDALDGACHRAYGSMPNMTWIISRAGVPLYKAEWTDASSVEDAIRHLLMGLDRRRAGRRLAPMRVERLDFRERDVETFYKGLERNGPKAVREFKAAFGQRKEAEA